jgi:hypothetical protein
LIPTPRERRDEGVPSYTDYSWQRLLLAAVLFREQLGKAPILRSQLVQEVLLQIAGEGIGFHSDQRTIDLLRRGAEIPLIPDGIPFLPQAAQHLLDHVADARPASARGRTPCTACRGI